MSSLEHFRFSIMSPMQHIWRHPVAEFPYASDALPGVTNMEQAFDAIVKVLYPHTKDTVATTGDLPSSGNTVHDFRVVLNDGDGKAAGYRWEQREGDASAKWYKVYDMDWGTDTVLSHFVAYTQDLYVFKNGSDDRDSGGSYITGTYAGQTIYGGSSANTNLTLRGNSGDGVGPSTGYVQVADNLRPAVDSTYSCGTTSERWLKVWTDEITSGTLTITGGSISDSSGSINFGDENIGTTGNITGTSGYFTSGVEVGSLTGNALQLGPGSIKDESGSINFDNENLLTSGTFTCTTAYATSGVEVGALLGSALILGPASIKDESGSINFDDEHLSTTGNVTCANAYATTAIEVGSLVGNALQLGPGSIKDESGSINFDNENLLTSGTLGAGATTVTSLDCDDINIDGQTISTDNGNKNVILDPNGTGLVELGAGVFPTTDSSWDIGKTGNVWNKLWIDGSIGDGSNDILISEILALRNTKFRDAARSQAVQNGDTIFWDATSGTWLASVPDTEIDHGSVTGIGDDDHTQYLLLAGRAGGQSIVGGTAASNTLTLESTSNVTKGTIQTKDNLVPFTNASYSGSWSGTDLGDATHYFKDVYTKGEHKGFRAENYTIATVPGFSAQNVGRLIWVSDDGSGNLYADTGSAFKKIGINKFVTDTSWNGTDTTKDVDVSSAIEDARNAVIQLLDNASDFDRVICTIKATSASNVRIEAVPALASGSYRLIVLE